MATSGSNTTWSSNGGHYVKVTWNETSQSTTENRSAVTVRLYIGSKSGWTISDSSNSYSLTINGTTYSGSNASISQTGSEDLILTKDVMIYHDSDGTKSFSMKGAVSGLYFGSISGTTFSGTLDTIARKSTMSSSANMTAGWNKTVSISRASSSFNHIVEVYVTRGATEKLIRTESFGTSETSKTLEWSNTQIREMFNSGYGYWTGTKFVLTTRSGTTSIGTNTYTGTLDWPNNNSVASMENSINVGSSFSVDINKASSLYSHEIKLTLTDGTSLATQAISSGTSFTMTPPSATIYSVGSNSTSVTVELWIRTVLTASTVTEVRGWTREKASSVVIPNTPPAMGTMSYTELNTTIAGIMLTSGVPNPALVQGYSHPRFTFTAASPMNSATITNYTVSIGGESLSRTTAGTLDFTPANLGGRTIKVGANTNAVLTATDSRGFTNSISVPVTYLAYSPPTVTLNTKRVNGFSDSVELTGSATISSLGGKNSVATSGGFKYKQRVLPAAFGTTYTNAASTTVNGYPTLTKITTTISNESAYEFEVVVTDRITSTTVTRAGSPGKPIAFMDSKLLSVGINKFPSAANSFEVDGRTSLTGTLSVSGMATVGQLSTARINVVGTNLEVANSFAEILKLTANSGTYGYMSIYNGTSRVGYIGSISNNSTSLRVASDTGWLDLLGNSGVNLYVAGTSRLHLNSTTTTVGNNLVVSGTVDAGTSSVEGSLVHRSGYMYFKPYDTTTSHSGAYQHGQLYYSGASSTNEFVFSSRTTGGSLANVDVRANNFVGKWNGTSTSSSIRYKTNIEDYKDDALKKVRESRIRQYNYKQDDVTDKKIGIVIEENAPGEIVSRKGDSIDIYGMTSMTWKAIQQMDTKTDYLSMSMEWMEEQIILLKKEKTAMKTRMTKLEKKNKELEERLSRLETLLGGD